MNAFWFAAFFGRGKCLNLLAEAGINILTKHKDTRANALHVAVERKHHRVVDMLVNSGFPLDLKMQGGLTALIIGTHIKDDLKDFWKQRCEHDQSGIGIRMCRKIIEGGASVNIISKNGESALSQAILFDNKKMVDILIKVQANLIYRDKQISPPNIRGQDMMEKSPFFQAIRTQKKWAIESMCDNGVEVE